MKKLLILSILIPVLSLGQDYDNDSDTIKLCSSLQANSFIEDSEAEKGLDRILSAIGASKADFVLQPCNNINNAVAVTLKGDRYIFYDREFMSSISDGNNWVNLFILAHEVGHHINNDALDLVLFAMDIVEPKTLADKRNQELEADFFAAMVLARLGAPLNEITQSISNVSSNEDDTFSTHPSRDKRLNVIQKGFEQAGISINNNDLKNVPDETKSEELMYDVLIGDKIIEEYETYDLTKLELSELILTTDSDIKVSNFSFENKKIDLSIKTNSNNFNKKQKEIINSLDIGSGYGLKINEFKSKNGSVIDNPFFFFVKIIPEYERKSNGYTPYKDYFGENLIDEESKHSITIKTSSEKDVVILLVDVNTGSPIRNVYVNKGTSFKMDKIPNGKYYVKSYQGNYWSSKIIKNGRKGGFQMNEKFIKDVDENDLWILRAGYKMRGSFTLYGTKDGTLETEEISSDEFFRN